MKIALISKLWERTDPYSTGGSGVVVGNLAEGLVNKGHQVTVFATGDSQTNARLISISPERFSVQNPYSEVVEYQHISQAFKMAEQFDVIDCHVEHKGLFFSSLVKTPVVHTLEYGEFFKPEMNLLQQNRAENFVVISQAMLEKFRFLNIKNVVYLGLDFSRFQFNSQPENYLLFLDRMSPQKGPHLAIEVAKKLSMKLILAGKTNPLDNQYLDQKVWPDVDGEQIKYVGEVEFVEKLKLLSQALALVHPHQYFEAFGLNMVEAQACGTPVLTLNHGAAREVVKDGQTGFVLENINQLSESVQEIKKIDRKECRKFVEQRFSLDQMVKGFEEVYNQLRNEATDLI